LLQAAWCGQPCHGLRWVSTLNVLLLSFGRLPRLVLTVFIVCTSVFFVIAAVPGNLAVRILGADNATPEAIRIVEHDLQLDRPLPIRFLLWLGRLARGDLGHSYVQNADVGALIGRALPATLELLIIAILLALAVSLPLGILAAHRSNRLVDRLVSMATFVLLAVPTFVMAVLLIIVFAVKGNLLPATGWVAFSADPIGNLRAAILPSVTLALAQVAAFTRLLRSEMITTLQEEYILMARAKGMSTMRTLLAHALRPSILPLVTLVGIQVGVLIGGSVIVETIFAVPGIGALMFNAIQDHDYPLVQGLTLVIGTGFVAVNFVVDVAYSILDPRLRRHV
jgi:peptide/nickel transport system permease protein